MSDLAKILGPKSVAMLLSAGIDHYTQIVAMGSVAVYVAVKKAQPSASLNLLWALEGALSGKHWRDVARDDRLLLLLQLERYEKSESNI